MLKGTVPRYTIIRVRCAKSAIVFRLQLAHNKLRDIPLEFTNCSALKYLNLRDNKFMDIPKAVSAHWSHSTFLIFAEAGHLGLWSASVGNT